MTALVQSGITIWPNPLGLAFSLALHNAEERNERRAHQGGQAGAASNDRKSEASKNVDLHATSSSALDASLVNSLGFEPKRLVSAVDGATRGSLPRHATRF